VPGRSSTSTCPAAQTVTELRLAGISVAIDDFGRGHSPLAYLHSHPVDIIKIDREFVSAVDSNPRDAAIVRAIVALGQALGTICVAEGVETTPELRRLAELGCEQVQGYLLGRPEPAAIFAAQLSDEPAPRPDRLAGWPGRDRR
jgi:EAL domain-containing protein (putative c-di-GMP-specific phosphodiesterase class I)